MLRWYSASLLLFAVLLIGCSKHLSDEEIASRVKAALYSDPELRSAGLSVAVREGEVTLAGGVANADLQLRAFKHVYRTAGVNAIRDEMRVVPPPVVQTASVQTALASTAPPGLRATQRHSTNLLPPLPEAAATSPVTPEPLPEPLPDPPPSFLPATQAERSRYAESYERRPQVEAPTPPPASDFTAITLSLPGSGRNARSSPTHSRLTLRAIGATGFASVLEDWFAEFHRQHSEVTVTYTATGAGTGVRQIAEGGADLAVTTTSLTKEQSARFVQAPLQIPVLVYATVPIYNIPGINGTVNFTGTALVRIFRGEVAKWNDPLLANANPHIQLPNRDLIVVHRSDAAPVDSLWTMYLTSLRPDFWVAGKGNWMNGLGGRGEQGVIDLVRQTPYSLGYADLAAALHSQVPQGAVENARGRFKIANDASLAAAALSPSELNPDGTISILNATGTDAYPIAGFEWFVCADGQTPQREGIRSLVEWVLTKRKGKLAQPGYAALPDSFASALWQQLKPI